MGTTRRICTVVLALAGLALAGFVVTDDAHAQQIPWPMPDGFDFRGECCEIAQPTLPDFPGIKQQIRYITWQRCQLRRNKTLCVDIGRPEPYILPDGTPAGCGVYTIPFNLRTCGGQMITIFSGDIIGTYARTWLEDTDPDQAGLETQVWRILINGDLRLSDFANDRYGTNLHIPQCHHDYDRNIYWFGYLDYRNDCETNTWTVEWTLDHECDKYHHNPTSARPAPAAGYHSNRSFNIVGPSLFVPTINIPFSQGFVAAENVRTLDYRQRPVTCFRDDPIRDGFLQPTLEFCVCEDGDPQYALTDFFGSSFCGTGFSTIQAEKDFVQKKIGFRTDAAGNPTKAVILKMGDMLWFDACLQEKTVEYFEGVEIIGGPPAFSFDEAGGLFPLPPDFDDDASSNDINCNVLKGAPHVSCKIICSNMFPK